ncbi:hypothetical protein CK203_102961 [Vitis vinifera]|uniref:Uncharacterized protein n=1 Tax=Vitis vinifera TaxID=29760 RepID=A0A438E787_VITVI|nr:hypothetical protein CK203_102961 [Vitis vinifera]
MSKNPEEAMDFLSYVAEVSRGGESSRLREVKAVITLRSGKEVDLPTSKLEKNQK